MYAGLYFLDVINKTRKKTDNPVKFNKGAATEKDENEQLTWTKKHVQALQK